MKQHESEPSNSHEASFIFTWYHREELQVLFILVGLIVFFSRSFWITVPLSIFTILIMLLLYTARIVENFFARRKMFTSLVAQYRQLKDVLHGRAVERSRILMAVLAFVVVLVLCLHRIDLARLDNTYATPTDLYWILFLGWYSIVCIIIAAYLSWLWLSWMHDPSTRIPFLDGLVASLFFYHGLSRKNRIVTFIASFLLGGVPSYYALRLQPDTPNGHKIACMLVIPVVLLTLGGAFYAMMHLNVSKRNNSEVT